MENTVVSLKHQIAKLSDELGSIDSQIFLRKQELAALLQQITATRQDIGEIQDSVSLVILDGNRKVEEAISQRNDIETQIRQLEWTRLLVEVEIEQKKNIKVSLPSINFANQVFEQVKNNLNILTNQTEALEETKANYEQDVTALAQTKEQIDADISQSLIEKEVLEGQLAEIAAQREAVLKAMAEEEVRVQALKGYERDVRAMHKQLTEQFQNVYKPSSRRSTI